MYPGAWLASKLVGHGPDEIFVDALDEGFLPVGPWSHVSDPLTGEKELLMLGADGTLGRDEFLRLLYGGRVSLQVAVLSMLGVTIIGVTLGAVAGYFRGTTDTIVSRLTEITMAFPALLFIIAMASTVGTRLDSVTFGGILGEGVVTLVIVFVAFGWYYPARIIRAKVLSLREKEFIEAALMIGASDRRIIRSHLMPHLVAPTIVFSTLIIAGFILGEAALSFLGVGIKLPTPSWGNMLSDAPNFYTTNPLLMLWPGLAVVFTTLAFNLWATGSATRSTRAPSCNPTRPSPNKTAESAVTWIRALKPADRKVGNVLKKKGSGMKGRMLISAAMSTLGIVFLGLRSLRARPQVARRPPPSRREKGGSLTIVNTSDFDFVDPQLSYFSQTWEMMGATQLTLLYYPHSRGRSRERSCSRRLRRASRR